jgi:carbonic anhydrase
MLRIRGTVERAGKYGAMLEPYDRRRFLAIAGAGALLAAGPKPANAPHYTAKTALEALLEGNARFVSDRAVCPPLTARRLEISEGQSPFAIVVSCSDSRVPVETVFDQIPGNIFGIRLAGNFVDEHGLGSIEYAVASFDSPLILVLGHTDCGAVKATVQYVKDGKPQPDHIQSLVAAIAPAAKATKGESGDWVRNATVRNVHDAIAGLRSRSPIVGTAAGKGALTIAGGIYDLRTGKVTIVT